jgi:hypothetical protein
MSHFAGSNTEGNHPEGQAPEDNLQEEDYENLEEIEKVLPRKQDIFAISLTPIKSFQRRNWPSK